MPKLLTNNKLSKWKRPLIGGALSALLFGFAMYAARIGGYGVVFFSLGFIMPGSFLGITHIGLQIIIDLLFWFIVGNAIAHRFKKNIVAIGFWLYVYFLAFTITLLR